MKTIKTILVLISLITSVNVYSQTQKEIEREKNKVEIFTPTERDNLQIWFHKKVDRMNLSEDDREEYFSVLLYYISKMTRLDDKGKDLTKKEIIKKYNELLTKQNKEVKEILSEDNYKKHIQNWDMLIEFVKNKKQEEKKVE